MTIDKRLYPVLIAAKIAVTAGLIAYILYRIDLRAAWALMREAQPGLLALAFGLALVQLALTGGRWSIISLAAGVTLPLARAALYLWESLFFQQFLPGATGSDAWRVFQLTRLNAPLSAALHSVFLDRVMGALALALLILLIPLGGPLSFAQSEDPRVIMVAGGLTILLVGGMVSLAMLTRLPSRFDAFRPVQALKNLSRLMREALTSPRVMSASMGIGLLGHLTAVLTVWLIGRSIGFDASLLDCLMIVPIGLMLAMIPITIGGWGVREGAMVAGFVRFGADIDGAAAVSLTFGVLWAAIGVIGGGIWLLRGKERRGSLAIREAGQ